MSKKFNERLKLNVASDPEVEALAEIASLFGLSSISKASLLEQLTDLSLETMELQDEVNRLEGIRTEHVDAISQMKSLGKQLYPELTKHRDAAAQTRDQINMLEATAEKYRGYAAVSQTQIASNAAKLEASGYSPQMSHQAVLRLADERRNLEREVQALTSRITAFGELPADLDEADLMVSRKIAELRRMRDEYQDREFEGALGLDI